MKINGRRIWYGTAIFISGLILVLSVVGVAGVWIVESVLADTVVQVFGAVGKVTESLLLATDGVDQKLENIQSVTTLISTVSTNLSQNVNDQGLIKLLLPEEQEQKLTALSASVKETAGSLRDMLSAGLTMYQTIDRMPFINLPAPSQEQVDKIESSISEIQSSVDSLRTEIAVFRSGVSGKINKVVTGADDLTTRLGKARDQLASLDARLAIIQESLDEWQKTALTVLVVIACLFTLFLGWIVYSQVELLRLYTQRWKAAGQNAGAAEASSQTAEVTESSVAESIPLAEGNTGEQPSKE